jgi:hypothetical protein
MLPGEAVLPNAGCLRICARHRLIPPVVEDHGTACSTAGYRSGDPVMTQDREAWGARPRLPTSVRDAVVFPLLVKIKPAPSFRWNGGRRVRRERRSVVTWKPRSMELPMRPTLHSIMCVALSASIVNLGLHEHDSFIKIDPPIEGVTAPSSMVFVTLQTTA